MTATFLQHDAPSEGVPGEYEGGILALEAEYPQFVRVRTFTEILGRETLSVGGREMWMVEVTDFDTPEAEKVPVAVSLSIHGPERAGIEGGIRYAEDLARWATDEPEHQVTNGTEDDSSSFAVSQALQRAHLYLSVANPDGWGAGDIANGGVFMRGNDAGYDLNRQFPTKGWTKTSYEPMTQPEAIAWATLMHRFDPIIAGDLHGELTSANNAFADIMYPAGEWDPYELVREERLARHMTSNVVRYFDDAGIVIGEVTGVAGMVPAEYATAYDVVGYDDSGFMGDFLTEQVGAVEMDVEHFVSHMVPNSTWAASLEEAHIAAVRAEIETYLVEAIVGDLVKVDLDLGRVGYLMDPALVTDSNGYGGPKPPHGSDPQHYRVTRMRYFSDLSRFSKVPLRKVFAADVAGGGLKGLDTFVISDQPWPLDFRRRRYDRRSSVTALKAFVRGGGNLVLTDGALGMLADLKIVSASDVNRSLFNAGHIDITTFDDPYLKGVHDTASQTYYEVPLGYSVDVDSSPHWTVDAAALTDAGGTGAGTIGPANRIGLGRIEYGKGTIGFIGALLPQPTEKFDHLYGLANYAVTVAGGQILNNMLAFPH